MITRSLLVLCLLAGAAHADSSWKRTRAFFEWQSWVRLGYGVANEPTGVAARTIGTPMTQREQVSGFDAALGIDLTLPIPSPNVRVGPWLELRGDGLVGGVEVLVARAPRDLRMFFYNGEGVWSLRAGASTTHATAAVAWGYRCPWEMFGGHGDTTRYMIGARIVASATRGIADPNDWSASLGVEFEPVGALRYLLGITSWY